MAFVFLAYFISALAFLYVYFTYETSPALIWPPVGIAMAAVLFGGYRMTIPIFLAQILAVAIFVPGYFLINVIIAFAYALQAAFGLYLFQRFQFALNIESLRNALVLVLIALFATMVEPVIATIAQWALGTLTVSPFVNFARAWGAGIFSVLIVTSFILAWFPVSSFRVTRREAVELIAAFVFLIGVTYYLFWTLYLQAFGVAIIFILPAALSWFAVRFHVRWFTLALVCASILGFTGSIVAHPSNGVLSTQLLANQIYIGLISAIFFIVISILQERRAAYTELEKAYHVSAAADKAKNEFIAILAHELRNPLAPIVSSLELLKLEPQTAEAMETIRNAESHTDMIRRLLDDLLDTARLTQKKFKLQKETVDVRTVLDQSIASVEPIMLSRGQMLAKSMNVDGLILFADPVRIKQIVINILNNASKYSPARSRISISAHSDGQMLHIRIADSGIGIEPHMLERIFEPFKQIDSKNRTDAGLGIGLFLTKRLTEMHGGNVSAASDGNEKGSVFTVRLPLSLQKPLENMAAPKREVVVTTTRILVVDDNQAAAEVLQKLLHAKGHAVRVVHSGEAAVAEIDSFKPELVVMDLSMPGMSGYEAARIIRGRSEAKIAALSGFGQDIDRLLTTQAGFDHHFVKPVSVDDLQLYIASVTAKNQTSAKQLLQS